MYEMTFEQWLKMTPSVLAEFFWLLLPWVIGFVLVINLKWVILFVGFTIKGIIWIPKGIFMLLSHCIHMIESICQKIKSRKYSNISYEERSKLLNDAILNAKRSQL